MKAPSFQNLQLDNCKEPPSNSIRQFLLSSLHYGRTACVFYCPFPVAGNIGSIPVSHWSGGRSLDSFTVTSRRHLGVSLLHWTNAGILPAIFSVEGDHHFRDVDFVLRVPTSSSPPSCHLHPSTTQFRQAHTSIVKRIAAARIILHSILHTLQTTSSTVSSSACPIHSTTTTSILLSSTTSTT